MKTENENKNNVLKKILYEWFRLFYLSCCGIMGVLYYKYKSKNKVPMRENDYVNL